MNPAGSILKDKGASRTDFSLSSFDYLLCWKTSKEDRLKSLRQNREIRAPAAEAALFLKVVCRG
jgi:hypothetical protein